MKRKCCFISLFVEEISKNIVEHGFSPGQQNSVVVKLIQSGETVTVSIKDTCRHFDPTLYYEKVNEKSSIDNGFGIKMIMKLSKNVIYTNNFNLNNLLVEV
ncbi:ATP-binding protein [Butyrivibrio sp. JL13D10]|uniref:ATP-binding protein n=1 Tax=Butyrivibrio sp. JL13D10 TaxID=3236815 RepID=UPI0038B51CF5